MDREAARLYTMQSRRFEKYMDRQGSLFSRDFRCLSPTLLLSFMASTQILSAEEAARNNPACLSPRHEPLVRNELQNSENYAKSLAELVSLDLNNQALLLLVPDRETLLQILPEFQEGVKDALSRCDNDLQWAIVGKRESGNRNSQIIVYSRGVANTTLEGLAFHDTSDRMLDALANDLKIIEEIDQQLQIDQN